MMTYTLTTDVTGETATNDGLVSFDLKAGKLAADIDLVVLTTLINSGMAVEEVPSTSKSKTSSTVETPVSDTQEEK